MLKINTSIPMWEFFSKKTVFIITLMQSFVICTAQISPGELSSPHANLEGISNCTQCHVLGDKVSNEKCLQCHTDIRVRITNRKGYHSSVDVKGKQCTICHNEHHGKNFQLIRLNVSTFNHNLTGYPLSVPHAKISCKDCHNDKNITDPKLKARKNTYLGVNTACLTCHADYHRKTLSSDCLSCHDANSFKPATKFNHATARFVLTGKHTTVECIKCHKVEMPDGKKYQQFRDIRFSSCTNCHRDPHQNQFGQDCRQCHNESSFLAVKGISNFDHSKTGYILEGKHIVVNCKACHKTSYTDPLNHTLCSDCHTDYHQKQFAKNGSSPDCSACHSVKGFTPSFYTLEQHNQGTFPLQGAHLAVPCFECHKKEATWSFRGIGINCNNCHTDIHKALISAKYYSESNCATCHTNDTWNGVHFDHSTTRYMLSGSHAQVGCRLCHFRKDNEGRERQQFAGLTQNCPDCHEDIHQKQFEEKGTTDCMRCHVSGFWKISNFDHNTTTFKLDGEHAKVNCSGCHKNITNGQITYILYKIKEAKCESCH
jgi:hypothetical protein